jgi:hypothetical protein
MRNRENKQLPFGWYNMVACIKPGIIQLNVIPLQALGLVSN